MEIKLVRTKDNSSYTTKFTLPPEIWEILSVGDMLEACKQAGLDTNNPANKVDPQRSCISVTTPSLMCLQIVEISIVTLVQWWLLEWWRDVEDFTPTKQDPASILRQGWAIGEVRIPISEGAPI